MELNDVQKITRLDGRLEKEDEREKGLRMPSGFLNCTTICVGLLLEAREEARSGEREYDSSGFEAAGSTQSGAIDAVPSNPMIGAPEDVLYSGWWCVLFSMPPWRMLGFRTDWPLPRP